jgi:hypothetical protein
LVFKFACSSISTFIIFGRAHELVYSFVDLSTHRNIEQTPSEQYLSLEHMAGQLQQDTTSIVRRFCPNASVVIEFVGVFQYLG